MVIVVAVFPEIHALPGAEGESALGDRDGEVHGGEGGAELVHPGRHAGEVDVGDVENLQGLV